MQHGFHVARFVDMTLDLGIAPLKAEELKKDEVRGLPKLSWRCSAKLLLSYNALNISRLFRGRDMHEGEALVTNLNHQPSETSFFQVTRFTQKQSVFEAKRWPASDASDATVRLMNTGGFDHLPVVSSTMTFLPCGRIWGVRQQHSSVLNQHHLFHQPTGLFSILFQKQQVL